MILLLGVAVLAFLIWEYEMGGAQSPGTIAGYARNAGFSGADLLIAVAIAYAESGGKPDALGDLTLGRSIGLWQINLAAHPEYSEQSLYDPQTNANAAFAIYRQAGNSFTPWTTFKTGAYLPFQTQAASEIGNGPQVADESSNMSENFDGEDEEDNG